jgi:hypothetical protein
VSEPKRYSPFYTLRNGDTGLASFGVEPKDDGIYVEYSDYWKLFEQATRLKAEVERLTKAGDAMEMTLQADFNGCPYEPIIVREAMIYWRNAKNAAKKGGQS